MQLERMDHVAIGVRDVEASKKWYCDVLGFKHLHPGVWDEPLFVGNDCAGVALFQAHGNNKRSGSRELSILHFAFRTSRLGFNSAQEKLRARDIKFESQDHQISHSIYFRDPDGHQLEITTYEV